MHIRIFLVALLLLGVVNSLDNGLGKTPQMAWTAWNVFECNVNETVVKQSADAIIKNGLHKLGYEYVNLDDCWAKSRNSSGFVIPDPEAFPSGMKALVDYVHSLGLKFGLYSDSGLTTCAGRPGSLGYEKQDAEQYAAWGVDYLKYDNCDNEGLPDPPRYYAMRDALNKTGRPIFFSLCDWVVTTATWGRDTGNSWRTTTDMEPFFASWINNLDQSNIDASYAGPGGWNDPDFLAVGNGNLTPDQNKAHFSLWALVKAPLIISTDVRQLTDEVMTVLSNAEVISVSQDPLGVQGTKLSLIPAVDNHTVDTLLYAEECNNSTAQKFKFHTNTSITSVLTGGCVGQFSWQCFNPASMGAMLYLQPCGVECSGTQQTYTLPIKPNSQLQTNYSNGYPLCLQTLPLKVTGQADVVLWNCSDDNPRNQQWTFSNGVFEQHGLCLTVSGGAEVWAGPLSGGSYAVALFNRALVPQQVSVTWKQLGFSGEATVRDLWEHSDLGSFYNSYTANSVNPQGIVFLKVTPTSS